MSAATVLAADPARLRGAALRLAVVSSHLSEQTTKIQRAANAPDGWIGDAAEMFQAHCVRLASDVNTGSASLGRAAEVLAVLAKELERARRMVHDAQSLGSSAASMKARAAAGESSPTARMLFEEAHVLEGRAASLLNEAEYVARSAGERAAAELDAVAEAASGRDRAWAAVRRLSPTDLDTYLNVLPGLPPVVRAMSVQQRADLRTPERCDDGDRADEGCNDSLTCALQTGEIMTAPVADALTGGATKETRELLGQDFVNEDTRIYGNVHAGANVVSIIIPGPKFIRGAKHLDESLKFWDEATKLASKEILPIPTVSNRKLQNVVKELYKAVDQFDRIGMGTTADAIRHEILTGLPTKRKFHFTKGTEAVAALKDVLKRQISDRDRVVAQSLLEDLQRALEGRL